MIKDKHPMDFYFILDVNQCDKECFKWKKKPPKDEYWDMDEETICPHLKGFMGYDGETVLECDKMKGAYGRYKKKQKEYPIITMADFNCLTCGFNCYIPWNYCPNCGKKL